MDLRIVCACYAAVFLAVGSGFSGNPDDLPWSPTSSKLLVSIVVVRHGDRTAQSTAPAYAAGDRVSYNVKFPIDNYTWPVDYGQLTGLGEHQTVQFGRYLRKRYVGKHKLLSKMYNHYETHVRSTDVDRTLVSAMGVMAGLYPGDSIQNGIAGTVLVPVHTVPYATDQLLDSSSSAHCPFFIESAKRVMKGGAMKTLIRRHQRLLDALPVLSNVSTEELHSMETTSLIRLITSLRDLRVCQRAHGMSQPKEVQQWDDHLERITDLITIAKWKWTGLGGLVGGRLMHTIYNRLQAAVAVDKGEQWALDKIHEECNAKGSDSDEDGGCPRKLVLYCGHDTTIFDLRAALGVDITVPGIVPYASHVIIELLYATCPQEARPWMQRRLRTSSR